MQGDARIHGKGLKPLPDELGVERADLVAGEGRLEYEERPARNVDGDAGERLVHGQVHIGVAGDAAHVAERLLHRLAERDADVFGGVVVIDVEVAGGLHRDVDPGMARQQVEHVIEKADPGRDRGLAAAVEIDGDRDVGFLGGALDGRLAHVSPAPRLCSRALYQGRGAPATAAAVEA